MADEIRLIYRKFDGALHWHMSGRLLGEDEHGVWVGLPAMTLATRGHEPPITFGHASVMLFPRRQWWTAAFNDAPEPTEIYCDVTTPPQWPRPDEVAMVDLDLDVARDRTGAIVVLDEDEFADHQVRYGYPADVIEAAERAATWLRAALSGREPFMSAYRGYLARILGQDNRS